MVYYWISVALTDELTMTIVYMSLGFFLIITNYIHICVYGVCK